MKKKSLVAAGLLGLAAPTASAATLTNNDVLKLLDAGMPESVIIQSITSASSTKFDTSADALIKLKDKGASAAVLQAVLNPKAAAAAAAPARTSGGGSTATPAAAAAGGLNPEEVQLVVNGQETPMQYIVAQSRMAARALGFGGMASYATLQGSKAARRLPADGVAFIVSVPKNAQVPGYLTLANFAVRKNDTREVSTGGGYMSYSSGINKDRVVPIKSEQLSDQSRARDGFVLYKIAPEKALSSGEYALVLYTQEVRVAGFFAQAANSYFDFGVD
ncbi:hypothetical protein SNE35_11035 [Paucibacter sp. R3-3]|uniref:Uncharacterized protein n=1 Tax=Roseateles agri TaxID=3098619 RepID=A0ABU5DIW3_9BURK|nr:hypothetical protein [Paucibacter sp. R3-3]MDY0745047.1 hypothetical protein [Paucibacter sp. R3-3]